MYLFYQLWLASSHWWFSWDFYLKLQREKTTHTSGCLISLMVSFGESKTLYVHLTYEHTSTCIWHWKYICTCTIRILSIPKWVVLVFINYIDNIKWWKITHRLSLHGESKLSHCHSKNYWNCKILVRLITLMIFFYGKYWSKSIKIYCIYMYKVQLNVPETGAINKIMYSINQDI